MVVEALEQPENPFKIELSDFKFIVRGKACKCLRLTVTWSFLHPEFGLLGDSMEGCLVIRTKEGLRFSPHLSSFGPNQSRQLHAITTDYHDLVLKMLKEHKTKSGRSYLDYVGTEQNPFRSKDPSEIDPELPLAIGPVQEGEEITEEQLRYDESQLQPTES